MQKTTKALAELRAHWREEGCPAIAKIAKKANVPSATANRYLGGITKVGAPETIRALAIAMDRRDIADSLQFISVAESDHAEDYIAELVQQWHEKSQQQHAEDEARHKQEMEDLRRDHRAERDELHEEIKTLRASFDRDIAARNELLRTQRTEKWICFALFVAAVIFIVVK